MERINQRTNPIVGTNIRKLRKLNNLRNVDIVAKLQLHGVGMENIQRCAKKYMGDIDMTICDMEDKKRFSLTIMMYERHFTPQIS